MSQLKETYPPGNIARDFRGINWRYGSKKDSISNKHRVTKDDAVRAEDVNELRDKIEKMWKHTHDYTDDAMITTYVSGSTTTCG
jgi:hypothetical protein